MIDKPVPKPGTGQILVKVIASTVTTADARVRGFDMPSPAFKLFGRLALGFSGPRARVLGTELAGKVDTLGQGVTGLAAGDRVVATVGATFGAHAQYVVLDAKTVARVPDRLTYEQAVALPFGACTALYFLDSLLKIRPGQKLLILGATGAVGLAAVQLAAHRGAQVHATSRAEYANLVRSLGAELTIDHTQSNPLAAGHIYDAILDTRGITRYSQARKCLVPGGVFLPVVATFREFRQAFITARGLVRTGVAAHNIATLSLVMELADKGVLKPVIGARFAMDQVADAYRLVDSGRKLGSAILQIGDA
jgi:NADPH:quinone reductase-like Zn-dependent oxidoreductase